MGVLIEHRQKRKEQEQKSVKEDLKKITFLKLLIWLGFSADQALWKLVGNVRYAAIAF